MRRYDIVVNGREFSLDVREVAADRFEVLIDGEQLDVQLIDEADLPQASITPAMTSQSRPGSPAFGGGQSFSGTAALDKVERRAAATPIAGGTSASRTLTAPMPGVISAIDVAPGAAVKRGDSLMTLEAMKMFNAIRAPRDAVIGEIEVKQGETVAFGDVLLHFREPV